MPHSETPGSPIARISPGFFAACHVLHRLSVPRHPPDALLIALDIHHRRAQGQVPPAPAAFHEDTSSDTSTPGPQSGGRACPPRSHDKLSLHPSINTPPGSSGRYLVISSERRTPPVRRTGGGGERIRTDDLLLAKQALSQLSYTPVSGIRRQHQGSVLFPDPWLLIPEWWAREDLNLRPHAYQARALTS